MLNCAASYAREIFKLAYDMEMMGAGYAWIVTDAVTSHPVRVRMQYINSYIEFSATGHQRYRLGFSYTFHWHILH